MKEGVELELESFCLRLKEAFQDLLFWSWDDRYDTVVGEFKRADEDAVCAVLEQQFSAIWDADVINSASNLEKSISDYLGGLSAGQWLYTTDPQLGAIIYCAWWRWGDGKNASIRIGYSGLTLGENVDAKTRESFRGYFKV